MRFAFVGLSLTSTAYAAEQPTLARVTTYCREEGEFRAAWNGARLEIATAYRSEKSLMAAGFSWATRAIAVDPARP
jgi:hypothetical protein